MIWTKLAEPCFELNLASLQWRHESQQTNLPKPDLPRAGIAVRFPYTSRRCQHPTSCDSAAGSRARYRYSSPPGFHQSQIHWPTLLVATIPMSLLSTWTALPSAIGQAIRSFPPPPRARLTTEENEDRKVWGRGKETRVMVWHESRYHPSHRSCRSSMYQYLEVTTHASTVASSEAIAPWGRAG